jgi:hypothetical protein
MLWLWLLARERHRIETGPLERYFSFVCAHCAVTTAAMVRTFGFGNGANAAAAERLAHLTAAAQAYRAVSAATCPHCSQLQPAIHEQLAYATKRAARQLARRWPIAAAVSVVLAVVLGFFALSDARHSLTLPVAAVTAAVSAGALAFALASQRVATPLAQPTGVWFSRDPSQGPASWFAAQPGPMPTIEQASPASRTISTATTGVAFTVALLAVFLWTQTFRKIYIVSAEGPQGALSFRVDDGERWSVGQEPSDDAPNAMVEVRTSSKHHVVVLDSDGIETTYVLDPSISRHGWVIAPHSHSRGLCLASLRWYYGTKPKSGDDELLGQDSELVPLPRGFDHVFRQPPPTVQIEYGSSTTRTSLRALDCVALESGKIVPFKQAARPTDQSVPPPTSL